MYEYFVSIINNLSDCFRLSLIYFIPSVFASVTPPSSCHHCPISPSYCLFLQTIIRSLNIPSLHSLFLFPLSSCSHTSPLSLPLPSIFFSHHSISSSPSSSSSSSSSSRRPSRAPRAPASGSALRSPAFVTSATTTLSLSLQRLLPLRPPPPLPQLQLLPSLLPPLPLTIITFAKRMKQRCGSRAWRRRRRRAAAQEAAVAAAEARGAAPQPVGVAATTATSPSLPSPHLPQSLLRPLLLLLLLPPLSISPPWEPYMDCLRGMKTAMTSQWFRLDESVFYNGNFLMVCFSFVLNLLLRSLDTHLPLYAVYPTVTDSVCSFHTPSCRWCFLCPAHRLCSSLTSSVHVCFLYFCCTSSLFSLSHWFPRTDSSWFNSTYLLFLIRDRPICFFPRLIQIIKQTDNRFFRTDVHLQQKWKS